MVTVGGNPTLYLNSCRKSKTNWSSALPRSPTRHPALAPKTGGDNVAHSSPASASMPAASDTFPALLLAHAATRDAARDTGKRPRHLADADLVAGRRARAPGRARPGRFRHPARHARGRHRREPPASLHGHDGRAIAGRDSGAAVPGRRRAGNGLCAAGRRSQRRRGRGSGTGRQDAGGARTVPGIAARGVRRSARPAPLRRPHADVLRAAGSAGPGIRRAAPDFFARAVAAVKPHDPAAMFYTSGTTGKPRAWCSRTTR